MLFPENREFGKAGAEVRDGGGGLISKQQEKENAEVENRIKIHFPVVCWIRRDIRSPRSQNFQGLRTWLLNLANEPKISGLLLQQIFWCTKQEISEISPPFHKGIPTESTGD